MATGSSSTASSSTVGISFDVDPLGKYSFQVSSLKKKTFQERVDLLIDRIEKTITALERYSSRAVEEFTIGKTFAQHEHIRHLTLQMKKPGGSME